MGRRDRVALLVVLVLVAGCSGLADAPNPPVNVTPAAVPADDPTPTDRPTPGIDAASGQFRAPDALAAAHVDALSNTSYTVVTTRTIRYPGDDRTANRRMVGRFHPDGRFLIESDRNGSVFGTPTAVRIDYYSDGRRVYEAFVTNGSTTANVVRDVRGNPVYPRWVLSFDPRFEGELSLLFAGTRITDRTQLPDGSHGAQRSRLEAVDREGAVRLDRLDFVTSVDTLSVSMVIDDHGFVSGYEVRYTGTLVERRVVVTRTVRYHSVGATTIQRPPWVDPLVNRTGGGDYGTSSGSNGSS